jgi:hypothetical protein
MKKFFALICVAAAITFVVGCGKSEPAPSTPPASEQPKETPAETPAEGTNP